MKKKYIYLVFAILVSGISSCDDFLDEAPKSNMAPEVYFENESQLLAYTDDLYPKILPGSATNSYGFYAQDAGTDNQIEKNAPNHFDEGMWKVPANDDSNNPNWSFEKIYRLNYFLVNVMPKFGNDLSGTANTIVGNLANIKHYIGEIYFLRAFEYFNRYQKFGDFPIIREPLNENPQVLTDASKRMPRNEVARFILSDLDNAINLMSDKNMATTRINKDAALLLKSRVALYEGTWLKYFKGTAFVPNGKDWGGKNKDYNANYQYPNGDIDAEIQFFLNEAMVASKEVADKYVSQLTQNTGVLQQDADESSNPYYNMFASDDLSGIPEVLLWREYVQDLIGNDVALAANQGNWNVGLTRGYVQNFLAKDGMPVYIYGTYADGDGVHYKGDKTIADVRYNRDPRLSIFLKEPGQKNILTESVKGLDLFYEEPYPDVITGSDQRGYSTGYALRKGGAFDTKYCIQNKGCVGIVIFRAAEALINYVEASYEKAFPDGGGNLDWDSDAMRYWDALRQRAGITGTINATVGATQMELEKENDWAAYSAGTLVDPILYNIRRERRCEFLSEGLRYMDLCRWRAMDQLKTKAYIPEGIHLWNTPMQDWYKDDNGVTTLIYGTGNANVSSPAETEYLRPYQRLATQRCYNGFVWHDAHYLYPIPVKQFLLTAPDGATIENSPIYQNPYWSTAADSPAER